MAARNPVLIVSQSPWPANIRQGDSRLSFIRHVPAHHIVIAFLTISPKAGEVIVPICPQALIPFCISSPAMISAGAFIYILAAPGIERYTFQVLLPFSRHQAVCRLFDQGFQPLPGGRVAAMVSFIEIERFHYLSHLKSCFSRSSQLPITQSVGESWPNKICEDEQDSNHHQYLES